MDSWTRGGQSIGYTRLESNYSTSVTQLSQQDKVPWYCKPNLRRLYLLMIPTCLAVEMTSGFDSSMVNGLQAVPSWLEYYHHPRSTSLGLMSAIYPLGSIGAIPFVSSVVDRYGRRYPILFGSMISVTGAILQGCATNFTMFMFARFLLGFANTLCVVAATTLIGELSHPKERAIMGGLFYAFHDLGAVSAAAITLVTFSMTNNWGWRIPSFLQAVPSLLQAMFIFFLPESPRWLIAGGRKVEASAVLFKYHAEGDESSEFVMAEYDQIERTLGAELAIAQLSKDKVFSTPIMRKHLLVATFLGLLTQWSGSGLLSHYLSPILDGIGIHDARTKHIINLLRTSWSFVNVTVYSLIVSRYPRRSVFLASTISVLIVFTAWTIASAEYSITQNKATAHVVVALMFLYSLAYNSGCALPQAYLVELFPFHVRSKGITVFHWWHRGAGFFNQFVNPIGLDALGWKWYIPYCVWDAFEVVFVYFMFPETSGRTLEELTLLFEDEQERHGEVGLLDGRRENRTFGTMHSDAQPIRRNINRPLTD